MRKRCNALACLLAGCLMVSVIPADALAQDAAAEGNSQETQAGNAPQKTQDYGENEQIKDEGTPNVAGTDAQGVEPEESQEADKDVQEDKKPAKDEKPDWKNDPETDFRKDDANEQEETKTEEELQAEEEVVIDPEDPGKYRLTGRGTGDVASTKLQMQAVSHQKKYSDCILQHGVDVSYHNNQGKAIDWEAAKATGKVDFAIIRVGYRGYSNGKLAMDEWALRNMQGAINAGIPIGVYIFSQAISKKEAVEEADFIVSKIKGYKIDLPVVLDFEYVATGVGRLYKAKLSKSAATSVCTSFCNRVKALGYTPMVYANKTMFSDKTYAADVSQEYPIWMANYTSSTTYSGEYEYWQYSSTEKVDGISRTENKVVDCNYRYFNTLRITDRTTDSISMKWDAWDGASGYDIYRKDSSGNYVLLAAGITETNYKDSSLIPGTAYSYKVYPNVNIDGQKKCIGFNTGITQLGTTKLTGKGSAFDKVKLTWEKVDGASSYSIERYNSSKKAYSNIKTVSGKTVSYTDGSKNASTKYQYRVRPYKVVFNGRSYGAYSKEVTAKTKSKVKGKTKAKKLALRKSASKSSKKLTTIKKKGTKITIVGSSGSWYRISIKVKGKTKTGYIQKTKVKLLKN